MLNFGDLMHLLLHYTVAQNGKATRMQNDELLFFFFFLSEIEHNIFSYFRERKERENSFEVKRRIRVFLHFIWRERWAEKEFFSLL